MKRLAIFAVYDPNGHIGRYVYTLLDSIKVYFDKLIIVINGHINTDSYNKLKKYCSIIVKRNNTGYDAGAYKTVLLEVLKDEKWEKWDELFLFNDTFYGAIHEWDYVFSSMERQNLDFWGLSKFPNGSFPDGEFIPSHIQSYFLCISKSIFTDKSWSLFWDGTGNSVSYKDAIKSFEIRFTQFFYERGYKYDAFVNVVDPDFKICENENPVEKYSYEIIRDLRFPILKKKVVSVQNYCQMKKTLSYIKANTNYDIGLIQEDIAYRRNHHLLKPYDTFHLLQFMQKNNTKRIYLYGFGKDGHNIAEFLTDNGFIFEKFIVTHKNIPDDQVIEYREIAGMKNIKIILALGENAFREVYPIVAHDFPEEDLFLPTYKW